MLRNKSFCIFNKVWFGLIILFLVSCDSKKSEDSIKYYSIKNLLNSQISLIKGKKISKTFDLNGLVEKDLILSPDLEKEFTLFFESDINKASYVQSYDSIITERSIKYVLKAEEDIPTKSMEINKVSGNVHRIKIINRNKNYLYRFDSDLELVLVDNIISDYKITIIQKMFWGDAETIKVKGKVL